MTNDKRRSKRPAKPTPPAKSKREPKPKEAAAIAEAREAYERLPARPDFIEEASGEDGALRVAAPHTDTEGHPYLVSQTLGSASEDFVGTSMLQLANIGTTNGKPSVEKLNASLAIIGAIAPANELEAALAVDMAATHELAMEMLRRMRHANDRHAMLDFGNLATKLSRTFTAQMKQLSDWRRGGEQVVRHIHVYEGGQAVVAETINLGGSNGKSLVQPFGPGAALPGAHPEGNSMPAPCIEGQEALPATRLRSRKRGAEGK